MKKFLLLAVLFVLAVPASAQITYVGAGAIGAAADAAADPVAALPASTATNDILLIHSWTRSTADTTTITDFTEAAQVDSTNGSHRWFWKRHDGSEADATCNRTNTTGDTFCQMYAFRGVITTGNPWNTLGTPQLITSTTDPMSITTITTGGANSMVVVFAGYEDNDASIGVMTGTDPSAYTEVYAENGAGADGSITMGYAVRTGAGATGTISYDIGTISTLTDNVGVLVLSLAVQPCTGFCLVQTASIVTCSTDPCAVTVTATTAGNLGVIITYSGNAQVIQGVTDDQSGSWSTCGNCNQNNTSSGVYDIDMAYDLALAAGVTTITVDWQQVASNAYIIFREYAVASAPPTLADSDSANRTSAGTTHAGLGSTLSGSDNLIVQGIATNSTITSIDTSYNDLNNGFNKAGLANLKDTGDGTAPTWTIGASVQATVAMLAFKQAAAPAPGGGHIYLPMRGVGD